MSRETVLAAGRRFTEATLTDTCVIGIIKLITNTNSLVVTEAMTEQHYPDPAVQGAVGYCKLAFAAPRVTDATPGATPTALQAGTLTLPVGTAGLVKVDDVVEILTSADNPSLPGKKVRIKGMHDQSYATGHRFPIEEES